MKKSEQKRRSQKKILKAATREFSANGPAGARIESIARRAGLNKSLIYRYFGDKEALFEAVLRSKVEDRERIFASQPPPIAEALYYWFEETAQDPDFIRLLLWEYIYSGATTAAHERRQYYQKQIRLLEKYQAAGELPHDVDSKLLFLALMGVVIFPSTLPQVVEMVTGEEVNSPRFQASWQEFLESFADLLRSRMRPESSSD